MHIFIIYMRINNLNVHLIKFKIELIKNKKYFFLLLENEFK
jgi:hypothetical protein